MNFIEAIFLGLVQGLTEFLPVSSSGHLTLLGRVFDIKVESLFAFTSMVHVGTLISVVLIMYKDLLAIFKDILGKRTIRLIIATLPAVFAAVLFGDFIESLFGGNSLGYEFLATGVILLVMVLFKPKEETEQGIGYKEALFAGLGQAVAIAPAISRSGSTIAALLLAGVNRKKAIPFLFFDVGPGDPGQLSSRPDGHNQGGFPCSGRHRHRQHAAGHQRCGHFRLSGDEFHDQKAH